MSQYDDEYLNDFDGNNSQPFKGNGSGKRDFPVMPKGVRKLQLTRVERKVLDSGWLVYKTMVSVIGGKYANRKIFKDFFVLAPPADMKNPNSPNVRRAVENQAEWNHWQKVYLKYEGKNTRDFIEILERVFVADVGIRKDNKTNKEENTWYVNEKGASGPVMDEPRDSPKPSTPATRVAPEAAPVTPKTPEAEELF